MGLGKIKATGFAVLIINALLNMSACSISNSAGSASDSAGSLAKSSESISDSSASSSNGDTAEKKADDNRYPESAQDYTVTFVRANAASFDINTFLKGLSNVAGQHGIVDWEANPKTYRAIGKGLKKAGRIQSRSATPQMPVRYTHGKHFKTLSTTSA
ncbi:MAG: putative lipoprotein [Gammaproteobacteria bacterium]|nr:putative lipoprotein [Gammaproteobacteria bacterium]